jgi:lipid A 4'-phosphatase
VRLIAAFAAAAAVFIAFPGLDLWVSGLFWSPEAGFFLRDRLPIRLLYESVPVAAWASVLALLAMLASDRILPRRASLYLLLVFAIGPGLLANAVFKDHWGRARPSQIVEFGGTHAFTPAVIPAAECARNCSFVSGHAAMAFAFLAFALLPASPRRRRWIAAAALAYGIAVSFARIVEGGHFLSDTVFAGLLVSATAWLLHRWVVLRDYPTRAEWRWTAFHLACFAAFAGALAELDRPLALYFEGRSEAVSRWFEGITQFGLGWGWMSLAAGIAALSFGLSRTARFAASAARLRGDAWRAFSVLVTLAAAGLGSDLVKVLVGRTRPKLLFRDGLLTWGGPAWRADHWSLPSGHTVNATALAMALYYLWPRPAAAYALFVLLIAASRVVLTQHYLSDTIAAIWMAVPLSAWLHRVLERPGLRPDTP